MGSGWGTVKAVLGAAILTIVAIPACAPAQVMDMPTTMPSTGHVPLARLLPNLILGDIIMQSPPAPNDEFGLPRGVTHSAHFSPLQTNDPTNPAVSIVQSFNSQMATQFSTFPLGSSTGGLTYLFDESLGTFRRGSTSFGPVFAERALTIGRGKLSVGLNFQHASYNTFEGQNLNNGSIKFYLRHEDCCSLVPSSAPPGGSSGAGGAGGGAGGGSGTGGGTGGAFTVILQPNGTNLSPPFKGDVVEAALSLKATADTTAAIANYGVNDHWDIGLAVPFVRVGVNAQVRARVLRLVTWSNPTVHAFDPNDPNADLILQESGHAIGIGDVVVRSKYHFLRREGGGLAAGVDLRLPTGDKNELLGAGGVQARFLLIGSTESGRFGKHFNIGYTAAGGMVAGAVLGLSPAHVPDEFNYTGGIEFVAHPRVTLVGDIVGRTLRRTGRLDLTNKNFQYASLDAISASAPPPQAFGGSAGPDCGTVPGISGYTCKSIFLREFTPRSSNLTQPLGTGGIKYNIFGNLIVAGSVLFPLTTAGLRSNVTATVGVDYAF